MQTILLRNSIIPISAKLSFNNLILSRKQPSLNSTYSIVSVSMPQGKVSHICWRKGKLYPKQQNFHRIVL
jgi:hypothetical protein